MTDSIEVRLTSDVAELPRLARTVAEFSSRHQLTAPIAFALSLALEEAVTNVLTHGYDDAAVHEIGVRLSLDGQAVTAEVTDDGRRFDPRDAAPPDLTTPPEARRVGGLGVFLIRRLMDEVHYEPVGGRNRLTLVKRLP